MIYHQCLCLSHISHGTGCVCVCVWRPAGLQRFVAPGRHGCLQITVVFVCVCLSVCGPVIVYITNSNTGSLESYISFLSFFLRMAACRSKQAGKVSCICRQQVDTVAQRDLSQQRSVQSRQIYNKLEERILCTC